MKDEKLNNFLMTKIPKKVFIYPSIFEGLKRKLHKLQEHLSKTSLVYLKLGKLKCYLLFRLNFIFYE